MSTFFFILTALAMIAVLFTLVGGVASMTKGGDFNQKYSNKLMRARVILQGLALLFFALAMFTKQ